MATCMVEGKRMARTRPRETEQSFMRAVCQLAALGGWKVFLVRALAQLPLCGAK